MNKVVIFGANGFVGLEVSNIFMGKDIELHLFSKRGGSIKEHQINKIDLIRYEDAVKKLKELDADYIIYLSSKIPNSFDESNYELIEINSRMHKTILSYWKSTDAHLIYASGCSVYGPHSPIPWKEDNVCLPDNYYSMSKLAGELLFYMEHQNTDLPLTILRINAPFGRYNRRKTVVNLFIEKALNNEEIELFGSGNREQDFLYIKDVANAFWLSYLKKESGIFNIASGNTTSMKDLAYTIRKIADSNSNILVSNKIDPQESIKVDIDISKAKKILNFSPEFSIEEGLKDCIKKYRYSKE